MSDDANAGGSASGGDEVLRDQSAASGDAGGANSADGANSPGAGALSGLADDAGSTPPGPATWPDDWRERLTGGDETGMALLKRIPSVDDLYKKVLAQEQTIRRGAHKTAPTLPDNPSEEQLAEYRKAIGVPETPDGYGITFAADAKPTEADTALLQGFLADMHGRHVPPGAAKAAFDWYQAQITRIQEEQTVAAQRARHHAQTELRKEYGADFKRNLALADEFLEAHPGLAKLVRADMPDLDVLRDLVTLARANADEDALYGGDGAGGGKSIDQEINELLDKSAQGKLTKADNARLDHLYEVRVTRDAKREARGRAA
jgi:hypothetical protein